jgi:anaerobic glycerol-3-phosphate dehydrogenase
MDALFDFDYLVIGGGSGGIASGKRAAMYGAKVAGMFTFGSQLLCSCAKIFHFKYKTK